MTTLSYRSTTITFALLLTVGLLTGISYLKFGSGPIFALYVFPWFIVLFWHRPLFLVSLWLVLLPVVVFFPFTPLRFGGFFLLPMDVAYFFTIIHLIMSAVLRREEVVRVLKENPFLSLFLFLIGVYIILYTPVHGKSALGEARKFYFHFLFPLLVLVSIKEPRDFRRLMLGVLSVAACISVVALLGLFPSEGVPYRTVNAGASLILMFALFSILVFHMNRMVVINWIIDCVMIVLFLSIVIASQHRSVWLAGVFGLLLLFGLHRQWIPFLGRAIMASILILIVVSVAVITIPKFGASITKRSRGIIDPYSDKAASWRIMGWRQQMNTLLEKKPLVGEGLGGYYEWRYGGTEVKASPHNAYVQVMLKFGFIGLIIYGLLAYTFFRRTLRVRRKLPQGPMRAYVEMGILNFGAGHAFMMGYGFSLIMLIFFALAMSAVKLQRDSWGIPA